MSWVRIWVHAVFTTKNRAALLMQDIRPKVFDHIRQNAIAKDIFLKEVGGYNDHAHCLISLNRNLTLAKTMQLIKGESAHWINKNSLTATKFAWQDDY